MAKTQVTELTPNLEVQLKFPSLGRMVSLHPLLWSRHQVSVQGFVHRSKHLPRNLSWKCAMQSCFLSRFAINVSKKKLKLISAVDGSWQKWGEWSSCSHSCGEGAKVRVRACNPPSVGGNQCSGNSQESSACKVSRCWFPGLSQFPFVTYSVHP